MTSTVEKELVGSDGWVVEFVQDAYEKGLGRAFDAVRPSVISSLPSSMGGARAEFMRLVQLGGELGGLTANAFVTNRIPERDVRGRFISRKVRLLAARLETELIGLSTDLSQRMARAMSDGLEKGWKPSTIARRIVKALPEFSKTRALTIARTELVRAQAQGQLDAAEKLEVKGVTLSAEWVTAGDDKVCPQCSSHEGDVLSLEEAQGMIPLHPNCRCAWTLIKD